MTQRDAATSAGLAVNTIRLLENGGGTVEGLKAYLAAVEHKLVGAAMPPGDVASSVAALRRARGLSQRALAHLAGLTQPTIIGLEKGRGHAASLWLVLDALGAQPQVVPLEEKRKFFGHGGAAAMSIDGTWTTPRWILDLLIEVLGGPFDLDPCSPRKDGPVPARLRLTAADDGLSVGWRGTVFMNPPYGREIRRWTAKAAVESTKGATVIALLPARVGSGWWHDTVAACATPLFLRGRLRFGDGKASAPFDSALAVYGDTQLADTIAGQLAAAA